ncbi:MAG: T9SS type A sorting domain-containing protein, partial [Candidatus Cloacimonadaceae bacterium]|nr:T9SS type A sorting domain-containing protein [Candidatus Cloacimonadaceae bacterium]
PVRSEYLGRDDFELGCASISSWGAATMDDPVLNGNLIHTRFMDWTIHPALIANPVLIVHHPFEAQEQKWMSFTYPGFMGALSGISYSGSAAFLNVGNSNGGNNFTGLRHVLFCIREALETADYNGDGHHNLADLNSALSGNRFRSGTIVHAMLNDNANTEPLIFESNNYGTWTRNQNQVSGLPTDHLAATNHFRVMIEPAYCYRYTNIINALSADSLMTVDRQWTMLSDAAGVPINLMGIQYIPSLNQVSWATTTQTSVAHLNTPLQLGTTALFHFNPSEVSDPIPPAMISLSCHPNPMKKGEILKLSSDAQLASVTIYNLRGQKLLHQEMSPSSDGLSLDNALASSGIYLIKATDRQGRSATAKLMWLN